MRNNLICALIACALIVGWTTVSHCAPVKASAPVEQVQAIKWPCGWLYGGGFLWWCNGWWS